jgi:uncharacterized protein
MVWLQHWNDVLFLHFPVCPSQLQRLLPPQVEVDEYAGEAWISYVLFRLRLRPSGLPYVPGLSSLVELNLRTYVQHRGQPGICFLSVQADNRLAAWAARLLTPLPYELARMTYEETFARDWRVECQHRASPAHRLELRFRPSGEAVGLQPGSLDAWLLERYRLYVRGSHGSLLAADVEHAPWRASPVIATVANNDLATSCGLSLPAQPAGMHFSPGVRTRFGGFRQVACARGQGAPGRTAANKLAHRTPHLTAIGRGSRSQLLAKY